jgi:hypothetical protein
MHKNKTNKKQTNKKQNEQKQNEQKTKSKIKRSNLTLVGAGFEPTPLGHEPNNLPVNIPCHSNKR